MKKIIIVEDQNIISSDLVLNLSDLEYDVLDTFTSGEDTINYLQSNNTYPDIIIMDIILDGFLNGIETAQIIKNEYRIPIIFLTSHSNIKILKQAKLVEPYGYLLKPVSNNELLATLEVATYKFEMEEKLRTQKQYFEALFNSSPEAIISLDKENVIADINKRFTDMFGYSRKDVLGKDIDTVIIPENKKIEAKKLSIMASRERLVEIETTRLMKNGGLIDVSISAAPVIVDTEIVGTLAIYKDISDRIRILNQVKNEKNKAQNYLDIAGVIIISLDSKGNVNLVNQKGCEILGLTQHEIMGKNWVKEFVSEIQRDRVMRYFNEIFSGNNEFETTVEYRVINKLENQKTILWHNILLKDDKGKINGILSSGEDVTQIRKSEREKEELYKKLKLKNDELAQIIYITSHDLSSPLVNINGFTKEIRMAVKEIIKIINSTEISVHIRNKIDNILNSDLFPAERFILSSIRKIESLLSGLLQLSRVGSAIIHNEKIDMNDLFKDIQNTFKYTLIEKNIKLDIEDLPEFEGDPKLINQMFSNLFGNAIKYLSPDRQGIIKIYAQKKHDKILYFIEDNGIGIDKKYHKYIFNIFKRIDMSKKDGEGLGLTIVERIARIHNGEIEVESTLGKGSRFIVTFPLIR